MPRRPKKRGPGRPPVANARAVELRVRLTTDEMTTLETRADRAGLDKSEYVRRRIFDDA